MLRSIRSGLVVLVVGVALVGCRPKETIVDIDTPAGGVQVERDVITDEVTVDVE